jgi:hypothetical protein
MFDHYRIPHVSFLAKYSQVQAGTGVYNKPPNAKLSYGTMVFVRANIVMGKLKEGIGKKKRREVGQGNREETGKTNRDDINGMERERDS